MCSDEKKDAHRFRDTILEAVKEGKIKLFARFKPWSEKVAKQPRPKNPLVQKKKKATAEDNHQQLIAQLRSMPGIKGYSYTAPVLYHQCCSPKFSNIIELSRQCSRPDSCEFWALQGVRGSTHGQCLGSIGSKILQAWCQGEEEGKGCRDDRERLCQGAAEIAEQKRANISGTKRKGQEKARRWLRG